MWKKKKRAKHYTAIGTIIEHTTDHTIPEEIRRLAQEITLTLVHMAVSRLTDEIQL